MFFDSLIADIKSKFSDPPANMLAFRDLQPLAQQKNVKIWGEHNFSFRFFT